MIDLVNSVDHNTKYIIKVTHNKDNKNKLLLLNKTIKINSSEIVQVFLIVQIVSLL